MSFKRWLLAALFGACLLAGRNRNATQSEAHRRVDSVLIPQFTASWSDWMIGHPEDKPGHFGSHWSTVDAKDVARAQAMRAAFHDLEAEMKAAGY